jgi:hypothetical protein
VANPLPSLMAFPRFGRVVRSSTGHMGIVPRGYVGERVSEPRRRPVVDSERVRERRPRGRQMTGEERS